MEAWAAQVVADHGKVNLIFNNAGVALGAFVETVKPEDFQWIMGINFWGVVWGTQAFLPHLKKAGEGHIVNTSSLKRAYKHCCRNGANRFQYDRCFRHIHSSSQ
jgi:NADP-dependent 3-hydroxy acid dehydrogenase YdfG